MGQILPGVPVWSMGSDSRWPGLPLVVFPGNVGGKEALVEALVKVSLHVVLSHVCQLVQYRIKRPARKKQFVFGSSVVSIWKTITEEWWV